MTTIEKLQRIRTRCAELLAIAEKRTPGKWEHDFSTGIIGASPNNGYHIVASRSDSHCRDKGNANATFIASCAGAAEAGWRSTIAAIDGWALHGFHPMNPNDDTGDGPKNCLCRHCQAIETLLAAWPEELLT